MKRRRFIQSLSLLAAVGPGTGDLPRKVSGDPPPVDIPAVWTAFKKRFVQADGRVIERTANDRTTSEGQAYALFFSLALDDRATFETVLGWTEDNLAQGCLSSHLPSWHWGKKPDGSWGTLDENNATDADLMLVYVLLQAERRWRLKTVEPVAKALGKQLAGASAADIPGLGPTLLPGRAGFADERGWRLNPSYCVLPLYHYLAKTWPETWLPLCRSAEHIVLESAVPKGFAPDWIRWGKEGERIDDEVKSEVGSYDAIRVYLWLGLAPGGNDLLRRYRPMAELARSHVPERVDTRSGAPSGCGPVGFRAALLPFLRHLGMQDVYEGHLRTIAARIAEDPALAKFSYYDVSLILFALGGLNRHYAFANDGSLLFGP